ncbi:aromatic-ring hydroxylase C-terminal domain-containing protein [Streptomyces platensis]|uniref:aromatic-ring hydroxylase C-terminal domain-containing protein n=1 Tax=Streptomyces platensis TaxID=58346 RepID=UPI0036871534
MAPSRPPARPRGCRLPAPVRRGCAPAVRPRSPAGRRPVSGRGHGGRLGRPHRSGARGRRGEALLVRPDGHVCWAGRDDGADGLRAALARGFGPPRSRLRDGGARGRPR